MFGCGVYDGFIKRLLGGTVCLELERISFIFLFLSLFFYNLIILVKVMNVINF